MRKSFFIFLALIFSLSITCSEEYKTHVLQKGETLWRVSKNYKINLDDLCKLNKIKDVTNVIAGTKLKVPVNGNTSQVNNNLKTTKKYTFHTLKSGETVWRVSKNYNVSVQEICNINNIKDITKIKSGIKLKIPTENEYLSYGLPLDGEINIFKTSHFRGMHIFTEEDVNKREVDSIDKGEVSYIDNIPGYGTTIFIKHENGLLSTYSGLEKITVKMGDTVKQDQKIGTAGNLSRYKKYGILFSIQQNGYGLEYDISEKKFIKTKS